MSEPTFGRRLARYAPLLVLAAGFAAYFVFGLDAYLGFDALRTHRYALTEWVARHEVGAALVYLVTYAAITAFSLPVAVLITLAGGFLFGWLVGGALTVVGATAGSAILFLAARSGFRATVKARAGAAVRRMEAGFRANAFNYLLFLRLVPIFPFWLVNIVPALLGVPLRTYLLATVLGIAPGSLVFASVGGGLGRFLDEGRRPDLAILLEPKYLLPLLGLAVLALGPVLYHKLRGRRPPPGIAPEASIDPESPIDEDDNGSR